VRHDLIGTRLGPYEIVSTIGAGGMGEVFRARDTRLGREVAVKVLHGEFVGDADRLRRFELEARAASALNHPAILTLFDIGVEDGLPYLVAELLEGRTLRERLLEEPVAARDAIAWTAEVARGLAVAHEKGIFHRDLKPENLFLTTDGRIKILDFGLAKLATPTSSPGPSDTEATLAGGTGVGIAVGTLGYMAPEQLAGAVVDGRADLFSLGCVLFELLSGTPAFRRATLAATLTATLTADPLPPAGLGLPLARLLTRCLARERDDRISSALAVGARRRGGLPRSLRWQCCHSATKRTIRMSTT
jgi:eukaryotic-like serine/threonine-protein kinase